VVLEVFRQPQQCLTPGTAAYDLDWRAVTTDVGLTATKILGNDPDRVGLILVGSSDHPSVARFWPLPDVSLDVGFRIGAARDAIQLWQRALLPIIQSDWYAITDSAIANVTVIEGRRISRPCRR